MRIVLWMLMLLPLMEMQATKKKNNNVLPYKNSTLPIDIRLDDLLERMTLEEKVGQMCQYVGIEHIKNTEIKYKGKVGSNDDANATYRTLSIEGLQKLTSDGLVGSYLHVVSSQEANYLQSLAQKSRLQIPLLIGIDAIHGNGLNSGATIYPTSIGQASSFDQELVKEASRQTALEIRAMGAHWAFTPNIEVARDPRWGRIGETFGEDPYLISRMGVATVKGLQSDNLNGPDNVLACGKHLVAGGDPVNGLNAAPMELSEHTLRDIYLPPYKALIEEANVFTMMAAHNELNGIPCHANKWLMTDILRKDFKFDGFFVSDWMDMERIYSSHQYAPTMKDAYFESVDAGMDMHMHGPGFREKIIELINEKRLDESRITFACRKILEAKMRLGLFENPYVDSKPKKQSELFRQHKATALELAEKSIVLLKNDQLLPLDFTKYNKILITGPNANSDAILGDWTFPQPKENVVTIYEGLQSVIPASKLTFLDMGDDVRIDDKSMLKQAADLASRSDLAIVVVGENPLRYDKRKTMGENVDRQTLNLHGMQEELILNLCAGGTPVVVILVGGRPLTIEPVHQKANAILQAWEPGMMGGYAIANILSGKVNPSGKLPVTIPRQTGQIQMIYNHKPSHYFQKYKDGESTPLYPFGYGLSYTTFEYSNIQLQKNTITPDESVMISVDLTNTGQLIGEEVIQLYIRDLYSAPTRPVKELKDFRKISLNPGERKTVSFLITPDKLAYHNKKMEQVVEKGVFEIMIGGSSDDKDLKKVKLEVL
ncbi:MAG: glycoside hydrolase family 3 N-terminal domain-containing protein [Bacteroidales bacterium]